MCAEKAFCGNMQINYTQGKRPTYLGLLKISLRREVMVVLVGAGGGVSLEGPVFCVEFEDIVRVVGVRAAVDKCGITRVAVEKTRCD